MSAGKPRLSGIPAPGKLSGIPTPGRSRSSSSAAQSTAVNLDVDHASRALVIALKANDPAQHHPNRFNDNSAASLSPSSTSFGPQSGRRSVSGRPSSAASMSSLSSSPSPKVAADRTKTPTGAPNRPTASSTRSASRTERTFDVGENVRIESLGYEGTLRFVGDIEGKPGTWAGVELSGGFFGKGKNDGSFNG
jgi:CAP-Gly domain-containing linker protein 1